MHWDGAPWRCKKKPKNKHIFSSTKLLTRVTVADKLVLVNPFWWNNHLFIVNALFIRRFKLICTASAINCKHWAQWRHRMILQYCTVRSWYMRKRIDHWCSVVPEKIPTLGSTVQWETQQASFPTGMVDPRVGIFLSPLNTNDGFYLSHPCYLTQAVTWELYMVVLELMHVVVKWCHCYVKVTS